VAAQGNDVYIGGVPAYSTLGWFADPILNTFVNYPSVEVARIIFHELAHQVVYVKGDTEFNESFAVTVEREGLSRWIASHGSAGDRATVEHMSRYREGFVALIQRYRGRLDELYRSGLAPQAMREAKLAAFAGMHADYTALKAQWGGYAGYDRWFAQPPSNALLASINLYSGKVPAFEALLAQCDHDLPRFYAAVKAIAREAKAARDARLAELAKAGVGARSGTL
jgi:predicted aminopeptidase